MRPASFRLILPVALLLGLPDAGRSWLSWVTAPTCAAQVIWAVSVVLPVEDAGWLP